MIISLELPPNQMAIAFGEPPAKEDNVSAAAIRGGERKRKKKLSLDC